MTTLDRTLGLPALIFYGVGAIVGAGIYSVIGAAAGQAGPALWQAFALAAVVAGLTALSYAELVTTIPRVGGEYAFLQRAFPDRRWVASLGGLIVAVAGAATAATVAIAFAGYLAMFVPVPVLISAFALLAGCAALNIAGIRQATRVNIVLTCVQVFGLVIVIVAGMTVGSIIDPLTEPPPPAIFTATALIFFVYTGFESLVNLAEEAKAPEKDLPKAILLSVGITTLLYILVALAVVTLASPQELAESDSPLSLAAGKAHPALSNALAWIALCATSTTALITFIAISRMLYGMARDDDLPRVLARMSPRRRTPWVAALAIFIASAVLLPLGALETVASIASLATLTAFIGVNACVIALRRREPELERPFRIPWAVRGVPIPTAAAILAAAALGTQFEPTAYLVTAIGIALAAFVALFLTRRNRSRPAEPDKNEPDQDEPAR